MTPAIGCVKCVKMNCFRASMTTRHKVVESQAVPADLRTDSVTAMMMNRHPNPTSTKPAALIPPVRLWPPVVLRTMAGVLVMERSTMLVGCDVVCDEGVGVDTKKCGVRVTFEMAVSAAGGVLVAVAVSVGSAVWVGLVGWVGVAVSRGADVVVGIGVNVGGSVTVSVMSARGAASVGCTLITAPAEISIRPAMNRPSEANPLFIGTLQLDAMGGLCTR